MPLCGGRLRVSSVTVMHAPVPDSQQPHRDPTEWGRLIESLDVASIFVVISAWLGAHLRATVSVDDIWQETLWRSWRDRDQHDWQGLARFRSWLLSIAHNRVRDAGRSASRKKRGGDQHTTPFSALGPDSVSAMLPPGSTTPSRVMGHHERAVAMEKALDTLAPELRQIVHMRLFEEIPMRDVATRLDLPLSTAKERLLRGVTRYRRTLSTLLGGDSVAGA